MKYLIIIASFVLTFLYSCDTPMEPGRSGDKLSGYITHLDTNVVRSNTGFYSISLYSSDLTNPFYRVPVRTDSLNLTKRPDNFCYESMYNMLGVPAGRYHIAVTWSRYPRVENEIPLVLGTYGCDTNYSCTDHTIIVYPNFDGNFRNIHSWSDTTRRMN
jgi:hypothetical protein